MKIGKERRENEIVKRKWEENGSWNQFKGRRKIVSCQIAVCKIAQRKQNRKSWREHEEKRDIEISKQSNNAQENSENVAKQSFYSADCEC